MSEGDGENNDSNRGTTKTTYDPNDFRIEIVKEENHDKYMEFYKEHFLTREQLTLGLHLDPEEFMEYFRSSSKTWMYTGASTCAIYTPTNKMAGLMIIKILSRDAPHVYLDEEMSQQSEKVKIGMKILCMLENSINVFDDPEVEKVKEIAATTVPQKYAGNKIAYRLAEVSEKRAIELGCQVATSHSTNVITQHIRKKMGFEECFTLDYATLEFDGKKVLDVSAMNGTTNAKVLRKYLLPRSS